MDACPRYQNLIFHCSYCSFVCIHHFVNLLYTVLCFEKKFNKDYLKKKMGKKNLTNLRSFKSRALTSPEMSLWSSGPENHANHRGLTRERKPRLKARVWSRICWHMRKWAIRWMYLILGGQRDQYKITIIVFIVISIKL